MSIPDIYEEALSEIADIIEDDSLGDDEKVDEIESIFDQEVQPEENEDNFLFLPEEDEQDFSNEEDEYFNGEPED